MDPYCLGANWVGTRDSFMEVRKTERKRCVGNDLWGSLEQWSLNSWQRFIQQINERLPCERLLQWALNRLSLKKVSELEERGTEIHLTEQYREECMRIDQLKS